MQTSTTDDRSESTKTSSAAHRLDAQSGAKGFAVAALVIGIAAVLLVLTGWGGIALGAAAIVLAIVALKKAQPRGLSIAGIVTGGIGLLGGIAVLIIVSMFMTALGAGIETLETGDLTKLEELGVEFQAE